MSPGATSRELEALLTASMEGVCDEAQLHRIEQLIDKDPAALDAYIEMMTMHAMLEWRHGAPPAGNILRQVEGEKFAGGQWLVASVPDSTSRQSLATNHSPLATSFNPQSPIPNPFLFDTTHTTHYPLPTIHSFINSPVFSYLMAALIVGLGLLIASAWKLTGAPEIAQQPLPAAGEYQREPEPKVEIVGRITGMVDCRWEKRGGGRGTGDGETMNLPSPASWRGAGGEGGQSLIPNPQSLISLGDNFALASGLMEITYNTGAKVILQGPCTYKVESPTGGYLSLGRLTARVEKTVASGQWSVASVPDSTLRSSLATNHSPLATNSNPQSLIPNPSSLSTTHYPLFTIKTPTATVSDLGTEFGVDVAKSGVTTSHVFRGSIRVRVVAADGQAVGDGQILHENQSARVQRGSGKQSDNRVVVLVPTSTPFTFVRELPKREIKLLDLVDAVSGSNGFSEWHKPQNITLTGNGLFHRVHGMPFVDGVFIPDGGKGPVRINSSGLTFTGFPNSDNRTYGYIHIGARGHRAFSLPVPAETITVVPAEGNAGPSHTDLFEGTAITGSTNINPVSDARDLFGGTSSSVEPGATIGADGNAAGDWSVSFHTAVPVTVGGFNLFLAQDGNSSDRAARGFAIYEGGNLLAQGSIATNYTASYGCQLIKVVVSLDAPRTASDWKLVVNNANKAGARALELDAFAGAPDPSTLAMTANGVLSLPANKGISFDLDSIRRANPGWRPVRFLATAGNTTPMTERGNDVQWSDIWLIVDGQSRLKRRGLGCDGAAMPIGIALGDSDHFLTLAGTDSGNDHQWNWTMFGDPRLEMEQTRASEPIPESRTSNNAKEGLPSK